MGWGELDRSRGQGAPQRDPRRADTPKQGAYPSASCNPPLHLLRSGAARFRPTPADPGVSLEAGAAPDRGPPDVGAARGFCARWRSLREAALGPSLRLPRLRNGPSQQPKFCLVSGCLFPHRCPRPSLRIPRLSLGGTNTNTRAHARNSSAPADGCVPGFVAQSPASPSGGFGACQLWGRECV